MAREIKVMVFKFKELSKIVQEEVIDTFRELEEESSGWWSDIVKDTCIKWVEEFGVEFDSSSVQFDLTSQEIGFKSGVIVDNVKLGTKLKLPALVLEEVKEDTLAFELDFYRGKSILRIVDYSDDDITETYELQEEKLSKWLYENMLEKLMGVLVTEYKKLISDSNIRKIIEDKELEFFEDGTVLEEK